MRVAGSGFFKGLIQVDGWMGSLFYRGVPTCDIKAMPYREMKYWNEWHDRITKAETNAHKGISK